MVDGILIAAVFVPVGLVGAFFGKKLFRIFLPIAAFLFGAGLIFNLTDGSGGVVQLGLGVGLGLFLAILTFLFYRIGFFLFFIAVGFFLFSLLGSIFPFAESVGLLGTLIFGSIFGLIAMFSKLDDLLIIAASAFLGANYVVLGVMASAVRQVDLFNVSSTLEKYQFTEIASIAFIAIYFLTLVGGFLYQWKRK